MGAEADKLHEAFPALHAVTGPQDYESVMLAVHGAAPAPHDPHLDLVPAQGIRLTPRHYAYLKISEGCNNRCSFCIIPQLRGDLVSRPAGDVLREAEKLVAAGVKELLVIAQDTGAYGLDLHYAESQYQDRSVRAKFIDLMRELSHFGVWLRLHYVYPYPHIDAAIELMGEGKILPYLDIPFQHASPKVLKAMRRPGDQEKTLERIQTWRKLCPDLSLRSTFIVGFPGETDEDFQLLLDWMSEAKLDRVGAFKYEPVAGAAANDLGLPMIAPEVQDIRYRRFMEHAQAISARKLKEKIGKRLPVIIDQAGPRNAVGRTRGDAPDIDGKVHMTSHRPLRAGEIVSVKIERADAYDLFGSAV
jgi:ribosomal protein S12 methylthiotransferase